MTTRGVFTEAGELLEAFTEEVAEEHEEHEERRPADCPECAGRIGSAEREEAMVVAAIGFGRRRALAELIPDHASRAAVRVILGGEAVPVTISRRSGVTVSRANALRRAVAEIHRDPSRSIVEPRPVPTESHHQVVELVRRALRAVGMPDDVGYLPDDEDDRAVWILQGGLGIVPSAEEAGGYDVLTSRVVYPADRMEQPEEEVEVDSHHRSILDAVRALIGLAVSDALDGAFEALAAEEEARRDDDA